MEVPPDYIGCELAAKELGISKTHLKTTAKKCGGYPGIFLVPGSSTVLIDKHKLEGLKRLFPKLTRPPKPEKKEDSPKLLDLTEIKDLVHKELDQVQGLVLEIRSSVKEGMKVSLDDMSFVPELQNAINQMNNRVTDTNSTCESIDRRMVRLETKLHHFIDQFIEQYSKDGHKEASRDSVLTKREKEIQTAKLINKFNGNP